VDEVKPEHNHLFDPERAQNSKSHKKLDADVEVRTIKLYRTAAGDLLGYGSTQHASSFILFLFFIVFYYNRSNIILHQKSTNKLKIHLRHVLHNQRQAVLQFNVFFNFI
jgi:hypothetical protein